MNDLVQLERREEEFIEYLLDGHNPSDAGRKAGYAYGYGVALKKRLSHHIIAALEQKMAVHGPEAFATVLDIMREEMPNPTRLAAAKDILDRVGAKPKEQLQAHIKANIFILPEKQESMPVVNVIEHE